MGLSFLPFHYALSPFAEELHVSDDNRINAIFAKGFKWRLTTKFFKADDIIEHSDKQLFRAILRSDRCLNELLPPRKNYLGRNLRKKVMDWNYRVPKTGRFKT